MRSVIVIGGPGSGAIIAALCRCTDLTVTLADLGPLALPEPFPVPPKPMPLALPVPRRAKLPKIASWQVPVQARTGSRPREVRARAR